METMISRVPNFGEAVTTSLVSTSTGTTTTTTPSSSTSTSDDDLMNFTDETDWWLNAIEEDSFHSPLSFDASENGLWNGLFVPAPPRPPFLDESISADGLTTCDLCTWALRERNTFSLDESIGEAAGEIGWTFTLIIVSVISAILGAIIMVVVLRCKRLKSANNNGGQPLPWWSRSNRHDRTSTGRTNIIIKHPTDSIRERHSNSGVWTWLGNRRTSANLDQIGPPSASPAENHYTHMMDDAYSPVGVVDEALYAELDRESIQSGNPSYQNTAYSQSGDIEHDIHVTSSAPSSAYYSDLSTTGGILGGGGCGINALIGSNIDSSGGGGGGGGNTSHNDRGYEIVGLTHLSSPLPNWDSSEMNSNGRRPPRLAAITESTTTMPSDYV